MKKALSLLLAGALALSLAACGASADTADTAPADDSAATEPADAGDAGDAAADAGDAGDAAADAGETYTVGIAQWGNHDALNQATQGFQDALTEALGDAVTFDLQSANDDVATAQAIINGFVSSNYDLILANATPCLQTAQARTNEIPILGTAVTEYGVALQIDDFDGVVGTNISGTSDLAPLDEQAAAMAEVLPPDQYKKVGLLYTSSEANSIYQIETITPLLEALGYECTPYSFADSNELQAICQSAADNCDALYVPTDNTAADNTGIIDNICKGKIPVFAGEEGICAGCGVATLSISYYDIGRTTGEMAAKILTGEEDVSTMAVQSPQSLTKKYNPVNAEALGITVPEDYVAIEG